MASSTEAPRSVNFKGITSKGWDCLFTVRAVDNENLLADMGDLVNRLEAMGVQPKGAKPAPMSVIEAVHVVPPPDAPPPVQPPALGNPDASYTFEAERLVGSTSGDKVYWKVQGGKFSQFGVTIWPEVLEGAGFDAEKLDPAEEYNLEGYTAYYTLNDEGKPKKVVTLAKE